MGLVQTEEKCSLSDTPTVVGRSRQLVLVNMLVTKIKLNRSVNMTILLENLLTKIDLVSKNVSKRGKKIDFGWNCDSKHFF